MVFIEIGDLVFFNLIDLLLLYILKIDPGVFFYLKNTFKSVRGGLRISALLHGYPRSDIPLHNHVDEDDEFYFFLMHLIY